MKFCKAFGTTPTELGRRCAPSRSPASQWSRASYFRAACCSAGSMLPLISMIWRGTILCPCDPEPRRPKRSAAIARGSKHLAVHFDEHVTIDIAQCLYDPALCLAALLLIEVRGRLVGFDRHADHEPFGFFALSEGSRQNGNSGD